MPLGVILSCALRGQGFLRSCVILPSSKIVIAKQAVSAFGFHSLPATTNDGLALPRGQKISTAGAAGCPDRSKVVRPARRIAVVASRN